MKTTPTTKGSTMYPPRFIYRPTDTMTDAGMGTVAMERIAADSLGMPQVGDIDRPVELGPHMLEPDSPELGDGGEWEGETPESVYATECAGYDGDALARDIAQLCAIHDGQGLTMEVDNRPITLPGPVVTLVFVDLTRLLDDPAITGDIGFVRASITMHCMGRLSAAHVMLDGIERSGGRVVGRFIADPRDPIG